MDTDSQVILKTIILYQNHQDGSNDKENLVKLTAREHFICHALLIRFLTGEAKYKMEWAFHKICAWSVNNSYHKEHYINSKLYEKFKENFQKGKNNSQFGTKWCYNTITGEVKKFKELPNEEWKFGRKQKEIKNRVKNHSMITVDELNERINKILNSGVDLSQYGWQSKVSKITGLSRREIFYTIKNSNLSTKVFIRN